MDAQALKRKLAALGPALDERSRRLVFAAEAQALGRGGIASVHRATGTARSTIERGIKELESSPKDTSRIRRPGGGRKRLVEKDPRLQPDLERLVEPSTRGDPESPVRWTLKSVRTLAEELQKQGHKVSYPVVAELLAEAGYSLQGNQKTKEGSRHLDRNAQFEHINASVLRQQRAGQPVVSVDTKKKELVGPFKNAGKEWRPEGMPERVRVHDFLIEEKGKAVPYGVYDLTRNAGWVSVGVDHDTASFAVRTIRRWWQKMGRSAYPKAKSLLITADAGGSNSSRSRLWKWELQRLADRTGLTIHVSHFPPGTSKWNKIEHRLFSSITQNWRGRPLVSLAVIVSLIGATQTRTGLRVRAELDKGTYPKGREVSDEEMAQVDLRPDPFHGDWNYAIRPHGRMAK
ncbi:MAG: ISAzo13 family transposase [Euryarchaeota archaeon]|nr:ISAzo13 family transposase [Euryarchaeota archaeon]